MKKHPFIVFVTRTIRDWYRNNALQHSAALSFYIVLALPALILSLISLGGMLLDRESVREEIIRYAVETIGESGRAVVELIVPAVEQESSLGVYTTISVVVLVIIASGIFGQLQRALNAMWNIETIPLRTTRLRLRTALANKLLFFIMLMLLSAALLGSLLFESVVVFGGSLLVYSTDIVPSLLRASTMIGSFVFFAIIVCLIYKLLPLAQLTWRDAAIGAIITAVLFTVGKFGIGLYLSRVAVGSLYGAAGSLVVVLVWIYYSCAVFLLGAEFTQQFANAYGEAVRAKFGARKKNAWLSFALRKLGR